MAHHGGKLLSPGSADSTTVAIWLHRTRMTAAQHSGGTMYCVAAFGSEALGYARHQAERDGGKRRRGWGGRR